MSAGRIMTLSVQSLHKLYSQFLEHHVLPLLNNSPPQITHLLRLKSAYEAHRYLEQVLTPKTTTEKYSQQNNTSQNGSFSNLPERTPASYQYALPTSPEHPRSTLPNNSRNFNKSTEKAQEEKKDNPNKMALRRTLTGFNYQDRTQPKQSQDQIFSPTPSFNHSIKHDSVLPVPSRKAPSIGSDFKPEVGQVRQRVGDSQGSMGELISKGRVMKEAVTKISKLFNDNHSKIEKYSKKVDSQNKLFNLNVSTKLQRKEDQTWLKEEQTRLKDYQFHVRQDIHSRKF